MPFRKQVLHNKALPSSFLVSLLFVIPVLSYSQVLKKFDRQTLQEFSEDRNKCTTRFMQGISRSTEAISLSIPASLIIEGMLSHDKSTVRKGMYIVKTIAVSTAITFALKYSINRLRPFAADSLIIKAGSGGDPSFPSGHTSLAFATATSLSFAYPKWYVIIPSYLWAGTVGYSRMYLGVHYPTDVFAGAVIGTLSGYLSYKLNNWINRKKSAPVFPAIY